MESFYVAKNDFLIENSWAGIKFFYGTQQDVMSSRGALMIF